MRWHWEPFDGETKHLQYCFLVSDDQQETYILRHGIRSDWDITPENATLIAEAPQKAEALEALVEAVEALLEHSLGRDVDQDWEGIAAIKEARAAVQAIKGGIRVRR